MMTGLGFLIGFVQVEGLNKFKIWSPSHISIVQQNLTELPRDIADDTKDGINQKELEVATAVCAMVKDNEQPTNW